MDKNWLMMLDIHYCNLLSFVYDLNDKTNKYIPNYFFSFTLTSPSVCIIAFGIYSTDSLNVSFYLINYL